MAVNAEIVVGIYHYHRRTTANSCSFLQKIAARPPVSPEGVTWSEIWDGIERFEKVLPEPDTAFGVN